MQLILYHYIYITNYQERCNFSQFAQQSCSCIHTLTRYLMFHRCYNQHWGIQTFALNMNYMTPQHEREAPTCSDVIVSDVYLLLWSFCFGGRGFSWGRSRLGSLWCGSGCNTHTHVRVLIWHFLSVISVT